MGKVIEMKKDIQTVGDLIEALQTFPEDMPIGNDIDPWLVYRVTPDKGETVEDDRGYICVEVDDGTWDD